jgi:ParB-like chromosome segregation protein Spo0J
VRALAQSIKDFGLKESLVLTSDLYVLSGHRRRVAAKLAGLESVPCRVEEFDANDERVAGLLTSYNRQRVKTSDAIEREELVLTNPEEAHRCLTEHRRQRSVAGLQDVATIPIGYRKRRAKISDAKTPFLNAIIKVLNNYKKFWPLTDRQMHYALLNDPPLIHASKPDSSYANNQKCYKRLCDLLTRARLEGDIPFHCLHDPTRPVTVWNLPQSIAPFIRKEVDGFLKEYYRDLLQSQPNHVEIIGEKNTIEGILRPVAMNFTIPYTIGRGYLSLPPRWNMAERFRKSGKDKLVLLVLSDFDPEGEDIAESFARSMRDDFKIYSIFPVKVALTSDQVRDTELPPQMKAKEDSSRRKKFVDRHGDDVYELEAIPPADLQTILEEAIDSVIDIDAFNAEVDREKEDAVYLESVLRTVKKTLEGIRELNGEN